MARHLKFGAWCILAVVTLTLIACGGGGGGGGGGAALSATGTVSDSTQAPVSGATVSVYNAAGTRIAQATTNVVGRYSFYGLPSNTATTNPPVTLTFKVTGPAGTFPAQADKIALTAGVATVLDFYLPSAGPATETALNSGVWQSDVQLQGPRRAVVSILPANMTGTPTDVRVAPYDVSQIGDGFPVYSVSPLAIGPGEIFELYAAAAFSVTGATFTAADLYLPVPLVLDIAAAAAVTPELYRFDETTNAWVAEPTITPTLTVDPVNAIPAFRATVTQAGYYRVGKVVPAASVTTVTGTLTYSDGKPAAGVTVHVTGSVLPNPGNAYGYQQVLVTNAQGQYTALVKTGGNTAYTFTAWGFGLELSQTSTTPTATITFAKPTNRVPATASLTLDNDFIMPNFAPASIGLIVASGRFTSDALVIDGTTDGINILTPGRADVSFNFNSFNIPFDLPRLLTLNATTKGSGIQLMTGTSFAGLAVAPATGYSYSTNGNFASIPIPDVADFPAGGMLVAVKTSNGYAKIAIDSVAVDANPDNRVLKVRSAFSLSGSF